MLLLPDENEPELFYKCLTEEAIERKWIDRYIEEEETNKYSGRCLAAWERGKAAVGLWIEDRFWTLRVQKCGYSSALGETSIWNPL